MFNKKYSEYREKVNNELTCIQKNIEDLINVNEPLRSAIIEFLYAPSKRIRVVLPILFLKALGEDITSEHLKLLSAIEIIHNASLVHDDIIDESEIRRGKKSIYAEFGNKLGVISGDYLLAVSMEIISSLQSAVIVENLSKTLKYMCVGEINQNFNKYKIGTIQDYIEKSKNKTGYLFEAALKNSLILSNSSFINKACEFALNFGIAFQIRDDLLNILKTDTSKPYSNDIEDGIYNSVVIYSNGIDNLSGGIEKTRDLLNNYINYAIEALNVLPENEYKLSLIEITELLGNV